MSLKVSIDRFIKKFIISDLVIILFFVAVNFLVFRQIIYSNGLPSWGDNSQHLALNIEKYNNLSNFTYAEFYNGLIFNPNIIATNFIVNKLVNVFYLIFSNVRTVILVSVILPYIVLILSLYYCFKELLCNKKIAFLLSLLYFFSNHNYTQIGFGWLTTTYSQVGGFLFITFFINYLKNPKVKYILLMSLVSPVISMNVAHLYVFFFYAIVYFVVYIIVYKINLHNALRTYSKLLYFPVFFVLLNLFWLLPFPFMSRGIAGGLNFPNIYSDDAYNNLNTFTLTPGYALFEPAAEVFGYFNSYGYTLIFILLLITTIYIAAKDLPKNNLYKVFFSMFIVSFSLSLGTNSFVLWDILHFLPGSFVVRSPQLKFMPMLFFFFLIITGKVVEKNINKIHFLSITLVIFAGVLGFLRGDMFSFWKNIVLPEDYIKVSTYLNDSSRNYKTVMQYPMQRGGPRLAWRDGIYSHTPLDVLINNPVVTRVWGESTVPKYLREVYYEVDEGISGVLGESEVKFLIAHKDYINFPLDKNFRSYPGIELIIDGENIELYEINDKFYKPVIYTPENNGNYKKISPVMYRASFIPGDLMTFNRQNDVSLKLYDDRDVRDAGYYNCNFTIGDLNLCDILLLKLKPLPKQPLDETYKNNWMLPEDSSGSYVLYYEPQIYFYIGLIVSFAAFILHILFLVLIRNSDKNKRLELN